MGRGPKSAKSRAAKPPVARKRSKDEGARVRDLEKRLAEAQAQQIATAEILRVISHSPNDIQPVFQTIVRNAVQLCDALESRAFLFDGRLIHFIAEYHTPVLGDMAGQLEAWRQRFPMPPTRETISGRAILDRAVIHVPDIEQDPDFPPGARAVARAMGYRSVLHVPMLRDGNPIGTINVARTSGGFSDAQVELLKTFADQAVIAIENVRLFNETKEALERQTATSEILRVISQSPTDVQPVFDTIVSSAAALCHAPDVIILVADGDSLRFGASVGPVAASVGQSQLIQDRGLPLTRGSVSGRAVIDRRTVHIHDVSATPDDEFPEGKRLQRQYGGRGTTLAVPLRRDDASLGVITLVRSEIRPFTDQQVALLETFADQAVIAIENVRLFTETKEALERQTATAEILRVISQSPTDVQPVFEAIAESAVRLCNASNGSVYRFDGELIHFVAHSGFGQEALEVTRRLFPVRASRDNGTTRAIFDRAVVHILDVREDAQYRSPEWAAAIGIRSVLAAPMLRDGHPIGVITVNSVTAGPFSDRHVQLLETFADQAVIAIENVRLFKELQEKNQALTEAHAQVSESLEQQTATSGILRAISQSPTELRPVFDTIVRNAVQLCGATYGSAYRIDGDVIYLVAEANLSGEGWERFRTSFPRPLRDGGVIRDVVESRRLQYLENVDAYPFSEAARALFATNRTQSLLTVPMIRQGQVIGAFSLFHPDLSGFPDGRIDLVRTFADQAVIAIENVRLFTETKEALERQTATGEILSVISSSPTDAQPVFDAIAASATRLCDGVYSVVFRYDGEVLTVAADNGRSAETSAVIRSAYPAPPGRTTLAGRALFERGVIAITDAQDDGENPDGAERARAVGYRAGLSVPMMRGDVAIGVINVVRVEAIPFTDTQIELLKTFADQAVIAIENVRLFTELQARTQDLTRSVGQLTALGEVGRAVSSTLDLETVLSTIVSRAIQLSGTDGGSVYEYDAATEEFSLRASRGLPEAYVEQVQDTRPRKGEGAVGRVAQTREPVQIADISDPTTYESRVRRTLLHIGLRALLAIPLIAEDQLVGALIVMRKRRGVFASEEVTLLQTFATQSALAIQNARLFREIEDKSRQLEVASQHKSEFLANMSHELRTPLNAIIGFSEVLSEKMFGELNEKQEEYSKDIHASGQHLLSLINDILDLSKIEAGRMELELSDFHLPTALDSAMTLVRERAGRRGIALHLSVDERLGQIQADERKVRQVVLNLLSNAIKFTPEGGRIEVEATPKDGLVEVSVSDTGVGIAPEDQEAVFEEFRQVGTADKKVEGTGLGLTLCRKFVELHGGRIWVKSEIGVGSTFTFTLPVRCGE